MKILYFTATGNSLSIAKSIGGETYSIPKLMKEGNYNFKDDKIGIVFPVFNLGVPKIVEEFLDKAKFECEYLFGIATYGMFSGAATRHLEKIGKRNGLNFSYINEIVMVDNYLPGFDMEQQKDGVAKKSIEEHLNQIVKDIKSERKYKKNRSIITEALHYFYNRSYDNQFEKNFMVENTCNGCQTCKKVCPVDNIKVEKQPVFHNNCQHCLACVQNCPKNAIHLKMEKSSQRFRNPNVTLKEIIDANN